MSDIGKDTITPRLEKIIKELQNKRIVLSKLGDTAVAEIKDRVQRNHTDVNGNDMNTDSPYSTGYAKRKAKLGASKNVNLTGVGKGDRMMNTLQHMPTGQESERVFFANNEEARIASYNQQLREFFGMSKTLRDRINNLLVKWWRQATGK